MQFVYLKNFLDFVVEIYEADANIQWSFNSDQCSVIRKFVFFLTTYHLPLTTYHF